MRDGLLEPRSSRTTNGPVPVWRNFVGLFRFVDKGNFDMDIPPTTAGCSPMTRLSIRRSFCPKRSPRTSPRSATGIIAAKCR